VISANTETRDEGYFRREWKLAVDRTHDMSEKKAFLLPIVIDNTQERGASVPDKFREVHWTRLPGGETPPGFVEQVRRLLSPEPSHGPTTTVSAAGPVSTATLAIGATFSRPKRALLAIVAVVVLGTGAYFAIDKFSKHPASPPTPPPVPAGVTPAAFAPPPHSIAVLPFVNMSGDQDQEYFSDGLTEELLNSLSRINELQVAGRTSSFYFKGKDVDLGTVAHKLNVAAVLEGSVRRSAHTVRITAQLDNAVTGFQLWSQTYDRDLSDVLQLQTEIANAVASALKVTLLGDVAAKIEVGGTRNPAAFDMSLRALKTYRAAIDAKGNLNAIAAYTEAIRLDPKYALRRISSSPG
jgi:TolB-like protein